MSLGGSSVNYGQSYEEEYNTIYDNLNSLLNDYKDDAKNIYENRNGFQTVTNSEIIGELESFKEEFSGDILAINYIITADEKYESLSGSLQEKFINLRSKYNDLQALIQRYIDLKKQRRMAATRNARNAAIKKAKNNAKKRANANKLKGPGIAERKTKKNRK